MNRKEQPFPNKELQDYKRRLSIALKAAKVCIFEVDVNRQLYTFFENSEAIFGVSGEQILQDVQRYSSLSANEYQKRVTEYFVHPQDTQVVAHAFESILNGEPTSYEVRMKTGQTGYVWCKVNVTPIVKDDGSIIMIGIIADIQDMYDRIDSLTRETQTDTFTGLYTKRRFEELSGEILRKCPGEKAALIFLDLDDFKLINDTYGHQAGDEVILSVAKHLETVFRRQDILARFGGDEFVVLMRDIRDKVTVVEKVQRLLQQNDNALGVTKSVGISFYPDSAKEYEMLLSKADAALYRAKKTKNTFELA